MSWLQNTAFPFQLVAEEHNARSPVTGLCTVQNKTLSPLSQKLLLNLGVDLLDVTVGNISHMVSGGLFPLLLLQVELAS